MTFSDKPAILTGVSSFSEVVDEACERLMDHQIKYSIKRIRQMEALLTDLERELDEFLFKKK
jgi:uncharacterized protein YqgV (UPF0045/DUF77 family)